MIKIMNSVFSVLKFLLLIVSFVMSFYIVLSMYQRLDKNYFDAIGIFIPYFLLLLLMCFNYVFHQKQVTGNIFYNLTCCLVFGVLIFASYRTMFDEFMLLRRTSDYGMSFHYFSDMVAPLKSMLYLLIVGNLCLIFSKEKEEKVESRKEPLVRKSK